MSRKGQFSRSDASFYNFESAGEMESHVEALRGFALLSIIDRHPFYGPQRSGEVERVARMPLLGETQIV